MLFLITTVLIASLVLFIMKKMKTRNHYSTAALLLLISSIISNICLAQNYTQSLIPAANDGIAISNSIAHWIIGEDGWSQELFKSYFDLSIFVSLFLLLIYVLCTIQEQRNSHK